MEAQTVEVAVEHPRALAPPFFEIGPKNLLRRPELEALARAAGAAGDELGVRVILTVPAALIAPIHDLDTGVLVFAQNMDPEPRGSSMGRVIAESLVDAGASGVMLNHDANPLAPGTLALTVERARANGLRTIVCAATESEARESARLAPTVLLLEPSDLIGTARSGARDWIAPVDRALRALAPDTLMMHAGGVASPATAHAIMAAGADGTGATSGVLNTDDPLGAARAFIAATRHGWERTHRP